MPWPYPFGETVQVLDGTATAEDEYGNDAASFPVKATYTQCAVWPLDANGTGGNEYTDGRDLVFTGLAVSFPPGASVSAVDRVVARGQTWEVNGDVQQLISPLTGWKPGLPVALRKVTG